MATTGVNFVLMNKQDALKGAAVTAKPYVEAMERNAALLATGRVPGGSATGLLGTSGITNNSNFLCDGIITGLDRQGFAKNGAYHKTTSGTTGVTVDLTDLTSGATSSAGDTTFATVNQITFYNAGAADMTIAPGGSNPSNAPKFTGTTPTIALPAGSAVVWQSGAGVTIDSTHKTVLVTPTSGGDLVVCVGGA